MFDFIGDIHGHYDALIAMLKKLGYTAKGNSFVHPDRKIFFLGDYIDRGPKIKETLHLVRNMVDNGDAIALMGNHEYNALLFHYPEQKGGHLRKHLIKNIIQHYETLKQFHNRQEDYESYLNWFLKLPLFYENEQFNAVHACWDLELIPFLKLRLNQACLDDNLLYETADYNNPMYRAVEDILKGRELLLPDSQFFYDKEANIRDRYRIKWWVDQCDETYKSISFDESALVSENKIDLNHYPFDSFYGTDQKIVFFGHYWLKKTEPFQLLAPNICCLDFSIAKGGCLAAYRYFGESTLKTDNFVFVS
jgi:hypothetical protein